MIVPGDQVVLDLMDVLLRCARRKYTERCRRPITARVSPRVWIKPWSKPRRLADVDNPATVSDPIYTGRIRRSGFIKLLPIRPFKPH